MRSGYNEYIGCVSWHACCQIQRCFYTTLVDITHVIVLFGGLITASACQYGNQPANAYTQCIHSLVKRWVPHGLCTQTQVPQACFATRVGANLPTQDYLPEIRTCKTVTVLTKPEHCERGDCVVQLGTSAWAAGQWQNRQTGPAKLLPRALALPTWVSPSPVYPIKVSRLSMLSRVVRQLALVTWTSPITLPCCQMRWFPSETSYRLCR